ncbi:hypothetical protein DCAR_0104347 [Daucus carota subsp. sativus]|uniref:Uncharacterized protein n=1 Tax=Daucus carota subsp. sativus TaxID=79200 RepID=A0A166IRS6_DAUCS|nr:PREDICTED: uncharacterized protein LOC108196471 [Daucus carota subsp. sativus]WOG85160.1 hypothetical protein DCAR_0104347 [Daucus carota subsp. sativus]
MAGVMTRIPMSHRIFTPYNSRDIAFPGELALSMSDTVFGFLHEESEGSPESILYEEYNRNDQEEDEEAENSTSNAEDHKKFWENQYQLLQATLYRTSSLESKIRNCTKEVLREAQAAGNECTCRNPVFGGCRICLMKQVSASLQNAGFNAAICNSKWKNLPDMPSGEHTFVDILDSNTKKGEVRVIVELNFRGEFEMARASEEYNRLVSKLPEVFVGKIERLLSITAILCAAAKKCMKEKKMHLGPWRKTRYMQAKWLRVTERQTAVPRLISTTAGYSIRPQRPRASMLTVDLLEKLPSVQCAC